MGNKTASCFTRQLAYHRSLSTARMDDMSPGKAVSMSSFLKE